MARFRLIQHQGANLTRDLLTFEKPAQVIWLAWYAPSIVAKGWEPYDQPHPYAYMPLRYSRFEMIEDSSGALLKSSSLEVQSLSLDEDEDLNVALDPMVQLELALTRLGHPHPEDAANFLVPSVWLDEVQPLQT